MTTRIVIFLFTFSPMLSFSSTQVSQIEMKHFDVSLNDLVSLQNGAKLFINYCLSCHGAKYMRYNRIMEDLNIPKAIFEKNILPISSQVGNVMTTTMSVKDGERWFGVAPPDLSLIGRLRDPEWIYNYLTTFYVDESSQSGWNNAIFKNVAMPHVLYELQGQQRAIFKTITDKDGNQSNIVEKMEMLIPGTMKPEEYDNAMRDLTNFLVYLGEPTKIVRIKYGVWVMLFFIILSGFAYATKKEYWRDIQ